MSRAVPLALLLALMLPAAGCDHAPAGGGPFFTGGMTEARSQELGVGGARAALAVAGGEYGDPAMTAYVARVGRRLAEETERPDLRFRFRLLDNPTPNAFAWPNGDIHITRGLLALMNEEAELAAVLAHEMGHLTARHTAESAGLTALARIVRQASDILIGHLGETGATVGAPLLLAAHSRGQELEADQLALRYLRRAGYDPAALARALDSLASYKQSSAETALLLEEGGLLASHPSADRRMDALSGFPPRRRAPPEAGKPGAFLDRIDGLAFGQGLKAGQLRGRLYRHPLRAVAFRLPDSFKALPLGDELLAVHPGGAVIRYDSRRVPLGRPVADWLADDWAGDLPLGEIAQLNINGLEAATAETLLLELDGAWYMGFLALRDGTRVHRLRFLVQRQARQRFAPDFMQTAFSFRKLRPSEAAAIRPLALRLYRVARGETLAAMAARQPNLPGQREEIFRLLNGLKEDEVLQAGERVKLVSQVPLDSLPLPSAARQPVRQ